MELLCGIFGGVVYSVWEELGLIEVYVVLLCEVVLIMYFVYVYFWMWFVNMIDYFIILFEFV